MRADEITRFLAKELIENYLWGERSDNPCEYYEYNKFGKECEKKDCAECLIEYLKEIEIEGLLK